MDFQLCYLNNEIHFVTICFTNYKLYKAVFVCKWPTEALNEVFCINPVVLNRNSEEGGWGKDHLLQSYTTTQP